MGLDVAGFLGVCARARSAAVARRMELTGWVHGAAIQAHGGRNDDDRPSQRRRERGSMRIWGGWRRQEGQGWQREMGQRTRASGTASTGGAHCAERKHGRAREGWAAWAKRPRKGALGCFLLFFLFRIFNPFSFYFLY
jgi:hypothetical protein